MKTVFWVHGTPSPESSMSLLSGERTGNTDKGIGRRLIEVKPHNGTARFVAEDEIHETADAAKAQARQWLRTAANRLREQARQWA